MTVDAEKVAAPGVAPASRRPVRRRGSERCGPGKPGVPSCSPPGVTERRGAGAATSSGWSPPPGRAVLLAHRRRQLARRELGGHVSSPPRRMGSMVGQRRLGGGFTRRHCLPGRHLPVVQTPRGHPRRRALRGHRVGRLRAPPTALGDPWGSPARSRPLGVRPELPAGPGRGHIRRGGRRPPVLEPDAATNGQTAHRRCWRWPRWCMVRDFRSASLASLAIGWGVAAALHLAFGSPSGAAVLRRGRHPAGQSGGGRHATSRPLPGRCGAWPASGGPTRRARSMCRSTGAMRWTPSSWTSSIASSSTGTRGRPLTLTRIQQVEHEAYLTLMAGRSGAHVPEVMAAGPSGPAKDAVLVTRPPAGRRLADLDVDDPALSDAALDDVLTQVMVHAPLEHRPRVDQWGHHRGRSAGLGRAHGLSRLDLRGTPPSARTATWRRRWRRWR